MRAMKARTNHRSSCARQRFGLRQFFAALLPRRAREESGDSRRSPRLRGVLIAVLLCGSGVLRLGAQSPKPGAGVFFVATNGNDSWSGALATPDRQKSDGPFASPARALEATRRFRAEHGSSPTPKIVLRGGNYFLN